MNFNKFWLEYDVPNTIKGVKTISKIECNALFDYFEHHKPVNILEFGVQYGCTTAIFLKLAQYLGYKINLNSWDIVDKVSRASKDDFTLHLENIENTPEKILLYNPDLVFLDAHPYNLTKNLMNTCLSNKINFMCHDIALLDRCQKESNNFTNKSVYTPWESYLIGEIINPVLWTSSSFENDTIKCQCIRDKYGLFILEHK